MPLTQRYQSKQLLLVHMSSHKERVATASLVTSLLGGAVTTALHARHLVIAHTQEVQQHPRPIWGYIRGLSGQE